MRFLTSYCYLLAAAALSGQTMVEHAVTAGAAKAASSGAQSTSSGMNSIFGKVSSALSGSTPEAVKPTPSGVLPTPPGGGGKRTGYMGFPIEKTAPKQVQHGRPGAAPQTTHAVAAVQKPAPAPAKPEPTAADFASVEPGQTRAEVVSKLGKPYSSISAADDGHLVEVMSYKNLGRLRVVDGKVQAQ